LARHRTTVVCSILAGAVYVTAALHVARTASATSDEVPHIGAGLFYLRGDLRLNREHPPLIKVLAALALPRKDRMPPLPDPLPTVELQWDVGRTYLKYGPEPALSLLLRARTPIVLLNSLLIVALALACTVMSGPLAACIAVWLAALCPLWLAHTTLVTTDGTATLFFFASAALAAQLLRCESTRSKLAVATALALTLAGGLATKYSLLSALGFIPLGFALDALRLRRPRLIPWVALAAASGAALGIGLAWGCRRDPRSISTASASSAPIIARS
jgi:dolichyl-phosphate-mannose--protein O-mannosyl transferase